MKRIFLYLATNLAIVLVLGITLRLLGFERILDEQGVGLDINSLLLFAALFGFGGPFISLAVSKWMARRSTGAKVISTIVMWFSRRREFHADAGGARLAGTGKMIAALERLKRSSEKPELPDQLAAFGINGGLGGGLKRLFMRHPPLDERIAALKQAAAAGQ